MKNILLILTAACFTASALAHPGKTDAKGGHKDSESGEYHIHNKPEAKKPEAKKPEAKKTAPPKKKKK